jgi:hypothetical protein
MPCTIADQPLFETTLTPVGVRACVSDKGENAMHRASLPILMTASPAARALLGGDLAKVAVLAIRAVLQHRKGIEVAHQQVRYRKHHLAFSSRIGRYGDLILELDVGDPGLSDRVILEADLRDAERRRVAQYTQERPRRFR